MKTVFMLCATIMLIACSNLSEPQADTSDAAAHSVTAHAPTPLDPLLKSKDKARGVEKTLLDADKKRQKALEDAGG